MRSRRNGSWVDLGVDPTGGHGTSTAGIAVADGEDGGRWGSPTPWSNLTVSTTNLTVAGLDVVQTVPADLSDEAQIAVATMGCRSLRGDAVDCRPGERRRPVINMSFGAHRRRPGTALMYRLFFTQMAVRHPGVLFVASAGNDGKEVDGRPGSVGAGPAQHDQPSAT